MKTCPFCAEDIQDAAIVCKHCGRDLLKATTGPAPAAFTTAERKKTSVAVKALAVLAVGMVALVIGVSVLDYITTPNALRGASSGAADEPRASMKASELYAEYDKNEVAADEKYKGRLVEVSGLVKDIGKDITGNPYVILGENLDNPFGTQALFKRDGDSGPAWEALRRAYEEHGLIVGLVAERARGGDDGVEELAER